MHLTKNGSTNCFSFYCKDHSMSSGPILEMCRNSPFWILMQFIVDEFVLASNELEQNISAMPAIISKLQTLYFYPRFIERASENILANFKRRLFVRLLFAL